MISINKGEITIEGNISQIFAEFGCLLRSEQIQEVLSIMGELDEGFNKAVNHILEADRIMYELVMSEEGE